MTENQLVRLSGLMCSQPWQRGGSPVGQLRVKLDHDVRLYEKVQTRRKESAAHRFISNSRVLPLASVKDGNEAPICSASVFFYS